LGTLKNIAFIGFIGLLLANAPKLISPPPSGNTTTTTTTPTTTVAGSNPITGQQVLPDVYIPPVSTVSAVGQIVINAAKSPVYQAAIKSPFVQELPPPPSGVAQVGNIVINAGIAAVNWIEGSFHW